MTRILALDISLNKAGFAIVYDVVAGQPQIIADRVDVPQAGRGKARRPLQGAQRLLWWRAWLIERIAHGVELVAVERPAYAAGPRSNSVSQIGEQMGVLKVTCAERDVPLCEVSPMTIKKYATGNGHSDKQRMLDTAVAKFGEQITDHDIADAAWLCHFVHCNGWEAETE